MESVSFLLSLTVNPYPDCFSQRKPYDALIDVVKTDHSACWTNLLELKCLQFDHLSIF